MGNMHPKKNRSPDRLDEDLGRLTTIGLAVFWIGLKIIALMPLQNRRVDSRRWWFVDDSQRYDRRQINMVGVGRWRRATDGRASERMAWLSLLLDMVGVLVVYGMTVGLNRVLNDNQVFLSGMPLLGWSVVAMIVGLMIVTMVWGIRLAWRSWRMALQGA
jgi:hypothetical protein